MKTRIMIVIILIPMLTVIRAAESAEGEVVVDTGQETKDQQRSSHPQNPTYVLGPSDVISIQALDAEEISNKPFRIDGNGYINLPLIGRLRAADLTVEQLEGEVNARLRTYVKEPQAVVSVTEFRSQPVSVLGMVNSPGVHMLQGRMTLLEILSQAGGMRQEAGPTAKITRRMEFGKVPVPGAVDDESGKFSLAEVNIKALLDGETPEQNILVCPHDVVSVPKADLVYVIGEVKKSGGFVLRDKKTISVLEALSMAEGLQANARAKNARILRIVPGDSQRTEIPVNVNKILAGDQTDVAMQTEDILFIPGRNATGRVTTRALETAVHVLTSMALWGALY